MVPWAVLGPFVTDLFHSRMSSCSLRKPLSYLGLEAA
jgi:hypothetical protein